MYNICTCTEGTLQRDKVLIFLHNSAQHRTGPLMKNQNHIVSEMMLAVSFNKRLLTACNIFLNALNYLKAYWKHKSSETAENFSFYRVSSILVKILSKKTDLNICESAYHLLRRVGSCDSPCCS